MENEEQEDSVVPVECIIAICLASGITDDLMDARIKRLKSTQLSNLAADMDMTPNIMAEHYQRLLQIIANAYQICGAHDCSDNILDVLAYPEQATDEQINAMLPYHPE